MRKISKAGTMLLALVLTLALFPCNPSQAPDEGTGNGTTTKKRGGGPTTSTEFILTETQFRAEQAVLAGYNAITDTDNQSNLTQENGVTKVTSPITVSGGTIEKDSYISTASAVRGGDVPVEMKIIFTPTDAAAGSITVDITGSAAYKDLSGFTADTYTAFG